MKQIALSLLLSTLAAAPARSAALAKAARELASAAHAAGLRRVSVLPFEVSGTRDASAAATLSARLMGELARDARIVLIDHSRAQRLPAQALVAGMVIASGSSQRALLRLVDAETGVILAASEEDLSEAPASGGAELARSTDLMPDAPELFDNAGRLLAGISMIGSARAEAEDDLAATVRDGQGAQARAAALALGRLGGTRALPALNEALQASEPSLRAAAALALGLRGDQASGARLAWRLREDPDGRVRRAAAVALARLDTPAYRQALESARRDDPDPAVRQQADIALGEMGTPSDMGPRATRGGFASAY